MTQLQKPKRKRGVKKKFFEVEIPLTATKAKLYGYSVEDFNNSVIKLDLTKNLRGKNLELKSKVELKGQKLTGKLLALNLISTYTRKMMRRGVDYIEDSIKTSCKDSEIIIKPFMLTRKRVSRAVRKTIRDTARKHIEGKAKTKTVQEIFSEIITNKFQKELSLKVKKVYPLALCEIRSIEIRDSFSPGSESAKKT